MPIQLESTGFYEWDDCPVIPSLGIHTAMLDECIAYYHTARYRGLFGHRSYGFDQDNLDFLAGTANATYLWLWDVSLRNIDGVYELTDLECAGINDKRPGIDFSRFPRLQRVTNHWNKADCGITDSSITEYHVWHFTPRSASYDGLEIPTGAEKLELNWANPSTLDGLPVLASLK